MSTCSVNGVSFLPRGQCPMEAVPEGLIHKHMGEKRCYIVRNASTPKYTLILANIYLYLSPSPSPSIHIYIYIYHSSVSQGRRPYEPKASKAGLVDATCTRMRPAQVDAMPAQDATMLYCPGKARLRNGHVGSLGHRD